MPQQLKWDESQWPVVVVHYPDGPIAKPVMEEYLAHILTLFERKLPFAVIGFHETSGSAMGAETRVFAASFNKKYHDQFGAYMRGLAIVSTSMLARTALMAVHWISPFPYPTKAFRTQKEALAWIQARLDS